MKLIRFGPVGKEKPGAILSDGTRIDVSGFGSDFDESFFSRQGMVELDRWLRANSASASRVEASVRLGRGESRQQVIHLADCEMRNCN